LDCEYREFYTCEEAQLWAEENYANILALSPGSQLYNDIFSYTGSWYKVINSFLRRSPVYGSDAFRAMPSDDYEDEIGTIDRMVKLMEENPLPDNILAYRFTHLKVIRGLCGVKYLKVGLTFSDRAFFSTALVRKGLEDFGRQNLCNCILKLYLPKGTPGIYVTLEEDRNLLNEQEFLLPPNVRFEITKIRRFSFPMMIECIALVDRGETPICHTLTS